MQNSISSFSVRAFLLTLWCPDEPYSQEVLQVVEECVAHSEVLVSPYGTGAARCHDEVRPVQSDARHTVVCVDGAGEWQLRSGPLEDCDQWHLKTLRHKHELSSICSISVLTDPSWVCCYLSNYIASRQTVLQIDLTSDQLMELVIMMMMIIIIIIVIIIILNSSTVILLCTHLI